MTTTSGRNSWAWATRTSAERCTARAWTRKRVCSLRMTSSACVPIEPEEPIRLTERISSSEVERLDREIRCGEDEEQAAVPRQDATHVLDTEVPLHHRLGQVADRGHDGDDDAVDERLADRPGMD